MAFGENPSNGDCRVCGSLASLCGLEQAKRDNDRAATVLATKRILLIHSIIMSVGGIPLLYTGDDFGLLNDYSYEQDPNKMHDARWVNRISVDDEMLRKSPNEQLTKALKEMIAIRQNQNVFGDAKTVFLEAPNSHCFAYLRENKENLCLCIAYFSEHEVVIYPKSFEVLKQSSATKLCNNKKIALNVEQTLKGYEYKWLKVCKTTR